MSENTSKYVGVYVYYAEVQAVTKVTTSLKKCIDMIIDDLRKCGCDECYLSQYRKDLECDCSPEFGDGFYTIVTLID